MANTPEGRVQLERLPDAMRPVPHRVVQVRREIHNTFTLELEPAEEALRGNESPVAHPFAAGQFNMLYVFGVGEAPISISGDPAGNRGIMHTVRAVGLVTRAITRLKKGDVLGLRGPFGSHWPVEQSQGEDVVIVAGGLGLAPLRPALYEILAQRQRFGRVALLCGARTPADVLYLREQARWRRAGVEVHATVDRPTEAWVGEVGVVTTLVPKVVRDPLNTVAMVCGPEIMMRFAITELERTGVSPESIFISMERNMRCAIGLCGHCQFGPTFVCKDGPVVPYSRVKELFWKREV